MGKYLSQKFRLRVDVSAEHKMGFWVLKNQSNIGNMADI